MRAYAAVWAVGVVLCTGCADKTFDERAAELEAEAPTYCGMTYGACDFPATVEPLLTCLQDHLAAKTGAWAREEGVERIRHYYAIDGKLIVLEQTYDAHLDIVWGEWTFCSIGVHPAGDCLMLVPAHCE